MRHKHIVVIHFPLSIWIFELSNASATMTQNGTSSFTVSLRPPTNDVTDVADDLLSKIRLINQQRDGFRNVTEESLQLEMNEMHDGASSASDPDEEGEDEEQKDAIESIFNKRMQMLHSLRCVQDNDHVEPHH